MSFAIRALGDLREVLAQVASAEIHGDPAGEAIRQLLLGHLRLPEGLMMHGQKPVFIVDCGGNGSPGTVPDFSLSVSYSWVPDPKESARREAERLLATKPGAAEEGGNDGRSRPEPEAI